MNLIRRRRIWSRQLAFIKTRIASLYCLNANYLRLFHISQFLIANKLESLKRLLKAFHSAGIWIDCKSFDVYEWKQFRNDLHQRV